MANEMLGTAKKAKKDEFYTQYKDIEREIIEYYEYDHDVFRDKVVLCPCDDPDYSKFTWYFAQNFDKFGLKKLICTSYAHSPQNQIISDKERNSPLFDKDLRKTHGKIFTIDKDENRGHSVSIEDIQFKGYLSGDGDFRSEEISKYRDESDFIITNPPFSLFREFVDWIVKAEKKFAIIGNVNAITYKEIFPLMKSDAMWLGASIHSGDRAFLVPADYPLEASGCGVDANGNKFIRVKGVRWFTNIDYEKRHEKLGLSSMADNLRYNRKLKKKLQKDYGDLHYQKYDNYDAIDVPFTECIPEDYSGIMGVPITFFDKYNPDQFEIIGLDRYTVPKEYLVGGRVAINGKPTYARILIKNRNEEGE